MLHSHEIETKEQHMTQHLLREAIGKLSNAGTRLQNMCDNSQNIHKACFMLSYAVERLDCEIETYKNNTVINSVINEIDDVGLALQNLECTTNIERAYDFILYALNRLNIER